MLLDFLHLLQPLLEICNHYYQHKSHQGDGETLRAEPKTIGTADINASATLTMTVSLE